MFMEQPTHRYIINVWIVGAKFCVAYFDRSGQVITVFPYTEGHMFMRLIADLMFSPDQLLGYDPTVLQQDSSVMALLVNGKQYQLKSILFMIQVLRGRGTVCWLVTVNDQQVIIKDTWADEDRQWEEAKFVEECQQNGICGVPLLINREDVQVGGICNSTRSRHDPTVSLTDAEGRIHCHLVMAPVCLPLERFSCKSELIQAFIDVVESMYFSFLS